jgi:hypothetical protein
VAAVPLLVTVVCAAALIAINARPNAIKLARVRIVQRPLSSSIWFPTLLPETEIGDGLTVVDVLVEAET